MREELTAMIARADPFDTSVRTAAWLRIARVLTTIDRAEADHLLDRGLALLADLPDEQRLALLPQAACLAACVAPERAFALHARTPLEFRTDKFLHDMARHGHAAAAIRYLSQWSEDGEFPYHAARGLMAHAGNDDERRDMLRSAFRAFHRRSDIDGWHGFQSVLGLFQSHWRLLPLDEGRETIQRFVRIIRERPDGRLNGRYTGRRAPVTFSSYRPYLLFTLLGPLRQLDRELADRITRENAELARAADVYPEGHDTDRDRPVTPLTGEALERWKRDWTGFGLDSRFFRIDDERQSDFRDSFDLALRAFARDTDRRRPNLAPRECWPSAEHFRTILYAAGKYEGAGGARLLDRVPDPALRLFAEIELAAGLAGLEQIGGITREQG